MRTDQNERLGKVTFMDDTEMGNHMAIWDYKNQAIQKDGNSTKGKVIAINLNYSDTIIKVTLD